MKKYLFIALAAAGMLSSCSSDDTVANESINPDLVPIKVGMGNIATAVTRGTGTVGANGNWNGEQVQVYMFEQGTVNLAQGDGGDIFNNAAFTTPTGTTGAGEWATYTGTKYYPASGNFDFWGYRAEDAVDPANIAIDPAAGTVTLPFVIDGSQDLMGAKAALTTGQEDLLTENGAKMANATRFYSAFAARKGVQPNMIFKHLLSRFTFEVKAGNADAADATNPVEITGIRVISKATGDLVINATAAAPAIEWSQAAAVALSLANVDATNAFSLAGNTDYDQIADALLVAPGESQYAIEIDMRQDKPGLTQPWTDTYATTITIPALDPTDPNYVATPVAEAGNSYKVKLIVYGLEEIKVETVLDAWKAYPETIDIDPDL